jgi:hypothetical protein
MIVGIFGDSFAEPVFAENGWPNLLHSQYSQEIKNYAFNCTSTFWSYQQLLLHINEIDVILFTISGVGRLYHPDLEVREVCSLFTLEHVLKDSNLIDYKRNIYKAAQDYYLHLDNEEFNVFVQGQIVKEVQNLAQKHNKKLILIPAFDDGVQYQSIFKMCLIDIMRKEVQTNFGDLAYRPENPNTRANHLSKENNKILAFKINEILNNTIDTVELTDFVFTKYVDTGIYWEIN